jgi:putative ABC transport system permease protein
VRGALPVPMLRRSSLRGLAAQPWQTGLALLGIALGVAIVIAVDLANGSARRAFALSLQAVNGTATHQLVGGPQGIEDSVYARLRTELGIRRSAPLVLGQVELLGRRLTLMGVDLLSERDLGRHFDVLSRAQADDRGLWAADAIALQRQVAHELGLQVGDAVALTTGGRIEVLRLRAVFDGSGGGRFGGLVFADIALAQELLAQPGYIDRIDLVLEGAELERLQAWLPSELVLVDSGRRHASLQQMSEAFHLNLSAMSLLALLVAGLLIYNTVTFSVLRRRRVLGIYRALGVGRRELCVLVGTEAALLGLAGSAAGVLLGLALGHGLVQLVTRTINDLYFHLHVTAFLIDPWSLARGFFLGLLVTAVAAALPAIDAAFSQPVTVQQRSVLERRQNWRSPLLGLLGLGLMVCGQLLLGGLDGSLAQGFVALVLQVFGYCLLVPLLVLVLVRAAAHALPKAAGVVPRLALRGIEAGISRTGLAVAALTVAVSVTVGVGVMVGSFRASVAQWLTQSLAGDVYVASSNPHQLPLPPELHQRIAALDQVGALARTRRVTVETEHGPLRLTARDMAEADQQQYQLLDAAPAAWQRLRDGAGVMVSEPLAWRHGLGPGDNVSLHTAHGRRSFTILGVFRDYSSSRGVVLIDLQSYQLAWRDDAVSSLVLRARPGADTPTLLHAVHAVLDGYEPGFQAVSNRSIREDSLAVFDRTFAITHVLRLLAILVAFVGVLSALLALQLERGREYAVLRATGMTPAQLGRQIVLQTGLLGLCAGLLALPLGLLMADVLIDVVNRRSFGWTMQHELPPGVLIEALALAVVAGLLAGLYPAWRSARAGIAAALREE